MIHAELTPTARKRYANDCETIRMAGDAILADLLEVLLAESERADEAIRQVAALEHRVRWLETTVAGLAEHVEALAERPAVAVPRVGLAARLDVRELKVG